MSPRFSRFLSLYKCRIRSGLSSLLRPFESLPRAPSVSMPSWRGLHRANEASLLVLSTDAPLQDEKPGRNTQDRNRSRQKQSRRPDAAGFRQGSKIRAGDPRRDPLTLFGLCVQEYEALLVFAEELGCRDVLDGGGGRSRPVFLGCDGLKRNRHGGGPSSPIVGASSASVDVVYVLYACLWQVLHLECDLHAALDVLEGCISAHPRVAALGKAHFHNLIFLGLCVCRKGQHQSHGCNHRDHQGCSTMPSRSVHHPPSISSICRYSFIGDAAHADTRTARTVRGGGTIPYATDDYYIALTSC